MKPGDVLTYAITFRNSKDVPVKVTITDEIPEYTTYEDGSADNSGVYDDTKNPPVITWTDREVRANSELTVHFRVTVDGNAYGQTLINDATLREGADGPVMTTKPVTNPVIRELVITKDLRNFVQHEGEDVKATFAFRITGTSASRGAYNNVVAMEFSGVEVREMTVTGIPNDIRGLRVEEIVSGNYTPSSDGVKLDADGKYKVTFTNKYDDTGYKTGTINNYKRNDNGTYSSNETGDKKSNRKTEAPTDNSANTEGAPGDQPVNN